MFSNDNRVRYIDLLRAVAIILVVLCHATERVYPLIPENINALPVQSQAFCFTCFTLGRLGVPIFLMITGYLLLPKDYDSEQVKTFWKAKWLHLCICSMSWFLIYDIFLVVVKHESVSAKTMLKDILLLHIVNMSHVWYLPMILGMYILIPFVSSALKRYDYKLLLFPMLIYSCYLFGLRLINVIIESFTSKAQLSTEFSSGFSGGVYGIYIVCGYLIFKGAFKNIKTSVIVCVSLLCFAASVLLQAWSFARGTAYKIWYDNLLILIASVGLFESTTRIRQVKLYSIVRALSIYSFPLYLTHNIVISLLGNSICSLSIVKPIHIVLLWTCCIGYGILISFIISKIPKIGHYLLYMK